MYSQKTQYALKALVLLTEHQQNHEHPMPILELTQKGNFPQKFMEAILLELKNIGILKSKKGKGGGYLLAKDANMISIGEIVRVLEGPLALIPCVSQKFYKRCSNCPPESECGLHVLFKEVRDATSAILDATTFQKVCFVQNELKAHENQMYFI
jgi:Rrf2 family protein